MGWVPTLTKKFHPRPTFYEGGSGVIGEKNSVFSQFSTVDKETIT